MSSRSILLLAAIAATLLCAVWVPWRVKVDRQRGDNRYLPWRYAFIFHEDDFDRREMARYASDRLGVAIAPDDVEPQLDESKVHLGLTVIVLVTGFGWLFLWERGRRPRDAV
jgi:hypothetical protein